MMDDSRCARCGHGPVLPNGLCRRCTEFDGTRLAKLEPEIARLEARIAELEAALRPLAERYRRKGRGWTVVTAAELAKCAAVLLKGDEHDA